MPEYVKTTGGSKWPGAGTDPTAWSSTEMTDADKAGLWKVVDPAGKNVAAEFKSKEEADAYIAAQRAEAQRTGGTTTPHHRGRRRQAPPQPRKGRYYMVDGAEIRIRILGTLSPCVTHPTSSRS